MVDAAGYIKSLFTEGRYETSAQPGAAAVVAVQYITNHRDTTAVVIYGGNDNPTDWATEFAQLVTEVGVNCALKHTDASTECHITFRGVRAAAE